MFVEKRLGEDVMNLEAVLLAEQIALERQARAPVERLAHTREHVEHRVKAGAEAPPAEVFGTHA